MSKKLSNFAGGILNLLTSAVSATVGSVVNLGAEIIKGVILLLTLLNTYQFLDFKHFQDLLTIK